MIRSASAPRPLGERALDAFVEATAIELGRGVRINSVSPGVLVESLPVFCPYFRFHDAVPGARVANATWNPSKAA